MNKISVYIFRHGETDWNRQGLFQGHTDIPLNDAGKDQAKGLQGYIDQFLPEIILCSDLIRAKQTAYLSSQNLRAPILVDQNLREINIGMFEGVHRDEVKQRLGETEWNRWVSAKPEDLSFRFPSGESKQDVLDRSLGFLTNLLIKSDFKKVAVSTHGGVIKRIVHAIQNLSDDEVPIKNCCLYQLEFDKAHKKWSFIGLMN